MAIRMITKTDFVPVLDCIGIFHSRFSCRRRFLFRIVAENRYKNRRLSLTAGGTCALD